ncbi:MAG: GDP-L-fucose synthase [Candidatus Riflebacteria bacterium]|nr:GDP-L-fucose synthase [Candidatus Riflebacteria bacterium]
MSVEKESKIFIAGARGLVGSAIRRKLEACGYNNLVFPASKELDLRDFGAVKSFFEKEKPEYVFLAAAKVGGIHANNTYPADFIFDNLQIQTNIIHLSWINGVKKLLFLGSSCVYPRECKQPIKEEYLLTGPLEKTNDAYAIAKITGIKMCESYNRQHGTRFFALMPTNMYGINDNYHPENSHVFPALIRKMHEAKEKGLSTIELWGSGKPKREFLCSDDLASATLFTMNLPDDVLFKSGFPLINVGYGSDLTISELASTIAEVVGFKGKITWNPAMPDGTPQKLLDSTLIHNLGWKHEISLKDGIKLSYNDFLKSTAAYQ